MAKPVRVKEGEGLVLTAGKEVADELQEYDRVRKLRQQRFDEWIGAAGVLDKQGLFDKRGRMYAKGLGKLLADMKDHGDYSGEFSFDPSVKTARRVSRTSTSTIRKPVRKRGMKSRSLSRNGRQVSPGLGLWWASEMSRVA